MLGLQCFEKLGAVMPFSLVGIHKRDAFGIALSSVFGRLDLLTDGFFGERRQWRAWIHFSSGL